jgi:hypothetical protein
MIRLWRASGRGKQCRCDGPKNAVESKGIKLGLAYIRKARMTSRTIHRKSRTSLSITDDLIGDRIPTPTRRASRAEVRRKHRINGTLPNALDLLIVCVESGLGLGGARHCWSPLHIR